MIRLPFLLLLLLLTTGTTTANSPDRFFKPSNLPTQLTKKQEYIELTPPLPTDQTPPTCKVKIIHHSFANTINKPPYTVPYFPPKLTKCSPPWSHITLLFHAHSKGDQYDRISALWLHGVELLRTSTAEPNDAGIFWNVTKDVTKYSWLFAQNDLKFTLMLENIVNDVYTGIYHVDVSLLFYKNKGSASVSMRYDYGYDSPADLIVPISDMSDGLNRGFWFRVEGENDVHMRRVKLPTDTRKAVLELYVSFHGNDEFWYSNPSNEYIRINNLSISRGNGAFREVFVMIDGKLVASVVPFPVMFTGGINPLFWEPVVGIGAFDLPSYDFDLSPVLGMMLDGKEHVFSIGISDGISYWLVDANLHIWLDGNSSGVIAKTAVYDYPKLSIVRTEKLRMLDGSMGITAKRKSRRIGWVQSRAGNFTTSVTEEFRFRNSITFAENGTFKYVKQKINAKTDVKVLSSIGEPVSHSIIKRKYPLKLITATLPGLKKDTYVLVTNVSRVLKERYTTGVLSRNVSNRQVSNGWMVVKDHSVLDGDANTNQTLSCMDELGCYVRSVVAMNGKLISDITTHLCPSVNEI